MSFATSSQELLRQRRVQRPQAAEPLAIELAHHRRECVADGAEVSGARKNRLDLSVGIALGSASHIALFVAPVLVLVSYVIGPTPMDLQFWPSAVVMMFIAAMTASMVTNGGRSAWFVGVLLLMVYAIFAMTLYLLPPRVA
jgi:calcium/proton exchanger cax